MNFTNKQKHQIARENAKWPKHLVEVPFNQWPEIVRAAPDRPIRVFRSYSLIVQIFERDPATGFTFRITVNRTVLAGDKPADGLSWDVLQDVKNQCGFAEFDAVEVYPRERDVVNVTNMRHLFVSDTPLPMVWRPKRQTL